MLRNISSTLVKKVCLVAVSLSAIQGCASLNAGANHKPIIDGKMDAVYNQDLEQCQQFAKQRDYLNDEVVSDAMAFGGIGAVVGLTDGVGGVLGGALVGAAAGTASGALDARTERKNIVINCMAQRGHKVLEATGIHR